MILFLGDIHKNVGLIDYHRRNFGMKNVHIIQLGDFGIGYGKGFENECKKYNDRFQESNIHIWVIRGNHDDPSYFKGEQIYSNIHFVEDYTVLELEGKRILCLGGAVSVDRTLSVERGDKWWSDEVFNYDYDKIKDLRDIDIIASHTAPTYGGIPTGGVFVEEFAETDLNLHRDILHERTNLDLVYDVLGKNNVIEKWIHGHFHRHHMLTYRATEFICLGIGEFYELREF
jgi:UDP-2,3-diacylglucosamine pyrophosphatase LpxH